jgi:hypothetical protein
MLSSGLFPGICSLNANLLEHCVCSIFIGTQPQSHFIPTCLWRWNRHSVPKRWHLNYRHWGITEKKECNKKCNVHTNSEMYKLTFHVRRPPYAYKNPNWRAIYSLVRGPNWPSRKTKIYWPCYFLINLHDQNCVQYIHNTKTKIHSFGVLSMWKMWRKVCLNCKGEKI